MVDAENADRMRDSRFASVSRIIEIGPELETWLADASPIKTPPCVPEETPFTIPYTSGTTGRPKGVLVSHRSRILNFYGMAAEYGCYSPDDRFLAIAPLCHGAGLAFAAAAIYFGGHTQLMNGFDPEAVLRSLTNDKLTGVFMVPTHFHGIFDLPETVLAQHRGAGLRAIISNAAPLPQPTKERIISHFGDGLLHETYGSTEAAIVTNLRPVDQLRKQSCVGLPFNSTLVSIRNESGEECPPGEAGELFSRSPFLFNGYWNNPEETANALQAGWVTAGDVACRDDEGYIFIVDRKKDMVISGGINIYPREVENVLSQVPAIVEAGVIGVPDERWGERLKAFVVLEPGTEFDQQEATAFCESQLAKFKVPREFEVIDRLPRNISGKLVKADLRKRGAP
jgi:long-chain acyl-CoA synthetase